MAEQLSTEGPQDFTLFLLSISSSLSNLSRAAPGQSLLGGWLFHLAPASPFVALQQAQCSLSKSNHCCPFSHARFCPRLFSRAHPTPAEILKLLVTFSFHIVLPGPCPSNCQIVLISSSQFISVLSLSGHAGATTCSDLNLSPDDSSHSHCLHCGHPVTHWTQDRFS